MNIQASLLMREFSASWQFFKTNERDFKVLLSLYFTAKKHKIVVIFYQIWRAKM